MADFTSAAVLVWMHADETPSIKSFEVLSDEEIPERIGFWELGAALVAARRIHDDGKQPWIKTDNQLLTPEECLQAYERFKNGAAF